MGNLGSSKQVAIAPAVGVLATAFLASMSVSSFFFIQPGDANANIGNCVSHAVVSDSAVEENVIEVDITLSRGCPVNDGVVYGVSYDDVAHKIISAEPNLGDDGYTVQLSFQLDASIYSHYVVSIDDAFAATLESK